MFVLRFLFTLAVAVFFAAPLCAQQSIFTTQAPQVQVDTDNAAGEYGMIFTSSAAGQITGLRFWKSSSDTGAHTGRLWRVSDRVLLATVTFTNSNTATGWQTQALAAPVSITSGTQYLVTVSTPRYYGYTNRGLASVIANGPLSTVVGSNGLYGLTVGAYPTLAYQNSNYFRDVVFVPAPSSTIDVTPNTTTVVYGATQQFAAALGGNAAGPVNWSATCGAITSSGLYTAPASGSTCSVTGSVTGATDTSAVTLSAPPSIDVTPNEVTVIHGATRQFSAVLGGAATGPVSWSATCGAINSSGLFTAPASGSSCDVTGSVTGATDTSTATLVPPPTIDVTPNTSTVIYGGTQQFAASLGGSATGPASWSATCGIINGSGLFTAPASGASCNVTGSVTGASDTSTVTLSPPPTISVTPETTTLLYGGTQQFAASLGGSATGPVSWTATCGIINGSGLFTAPDSDSSCTVTGSVTGAGDMATVTVLAALPPTIDVFPVLVTLNYGGTQQYVATLGGSATDPVTWTATCGVIDDTGMYTAPASGSSCSVFGSVTGASDSVTVTLAVPTINVTPNAVTLNYNATQQFSASLGGSATGPAIWSVSCGAINSSGLYTAPASGSSCDITGSVTGATDTSTVTLSTPTIDVTPNTVSLNFSATQQFTAALGGGASGPVTWSATCGTINASGLYTAPATGSSCGVTGTNSGATDTSIVSLPQGLTTNYYHDFRNPEWLVNNRTADTTNNEIACYRPEQVSMTNGLVITAIYQTNTCSSGISPSQQWPYTSGQIMWNSRAFLYGTVEFRAKFPTGQGTWPAVWMHGVVCQEYFKNWNGTCGWPTPPADEVDIAEVASAIFAGTVNQQIHSGSHNDGCRPTVNLSQYHTYQFIWQPGSMIWKIDGNTTCTITGSYVPSNPMFLIINVAVGGIGGGTPNPSVFPQSLFVDYIKITP